MNHPEFSGGAGGKAPCRGPGVSPDSLFFSGGPFGAAKKEFGGHPQTPAQGLAAPVNPAPQAVLKNAG